MNTIGRPDAGNGATQSIENLDNIRGIDVRGGSVNGRGNQRFSIGHALAVGVAAAIAGLVSSEVSSHLQDIVFGGKVPKELLEYYSDLRILTPLSWGAMGAYLGGNWPIIRNELSNMFPVE